MTCTIIGLVVACSGAPVQTTPAQSLALMKERAAQIIDVQVPDRPAGVTRRNTPEEALAIMKEHETKIVPTDLLYRPIAVAQPNTIWFQSPRKKFGEAPWWWSELYDSWWYEPWVVKPWQEQPVPEPCCGWW
jgi:hypothetical protein